MCVHSIRLCTCVYVSHVFSAYVHIWTYIRTYIFVALVGGGGSSSHAHW